MPRVEQGGFSLVESIAAMGLMAIVLVSIAGLFSIGGRQVRSGRSSSEALAIGRQILEEITSGAFACTWQQLDPGGAFATPSYRADTETNTSMVCAPWRALLHERLGPNAHAAITIDSLVASGTPANLDAGARTVRITVTVAWTELARARRVTVVTVRT